MTTALQSKPIHGISNRIVLASRNGYVTIIDKPFDWTDVAPEGCDFKVGDAVAYTNDYGVTVTLKVWGFGNPDNHNGRCVYIFTDAHWFPVDPKQCKKVSV